MSRMISHVLRSQPASRVRARPLAWACLLVWAAAAAPPAAAQGDDNPVYVDDSPRAWELFRQASDQQAENPGEAARLYQELLDEYALKLIPRSEVEQDHFGAVRGRVHDALLNDPATLERYRTMQTPHAERLLAAGKLQAVYRTRFLTEPAVEAAMRLAQQAYEAARFRTALEYLRGIGRHPDLDADRDAHRHMLIALCANYLDDSETRDQSIATLRDGTGTAARARYEDLMRILRQGPGPDLAHGVNMLDDRPRASVVSLVDNPIWQIPLPDSFFAQRFNAADRADTRLSARAARVTGEALTLMPTIADRAIYINEGQVIRALDRFSVREFWKTEIGDASLINSRATAELTDSNIIKVEGDRLVTVTGYGTAQARIGPARVVCLNRITGEVLWEVALHNLLAGEEYQGLFPQGAVTIADGTVYVMARKITKQVLTSVYVIALDLYADSEADRLRWVQYIASSASIQGADVRPFSYMAAEQGRLFIATPLGAVACLDQADGEVKWLRRIQTPLVHMTSLDPWEMSAPVLTDLGVTAISPDQQTVYIYDRATGNELLRLNASAWGTPHYLLSDGPRVFAVSRDNITCVHVEAPDLTMWKLDQHLTRDQYFDLRGRVQLTADALIVPTQVGLQLVDLETGMVQRTLPATVAGNPLAYGSELFVATSDELIAYMPLAVAEGMLREQISTSPHDPLPALSLLRLAMRSDDPAHAIGLALEASQHAIDVLERIRAAQFRADAQRELFETLIAIADRSHDVSFEQAGALHARIASVAEQPEQRVEHLLARGAWLRAAADRNDRTHLNGAIESFQAILADPALASARRESNGVIRTAADVAVERLSSLLTSFGTGVYAPFEHEARRQLDELADDATAEELIRLALAYPFATASREALAMAAEQELTRDGHRAALHSLQSLATAAVTEADRTGAVSRVIDLTMMHGWRDVARHWVAWARERHGIALADLASETVSETDLTVLLGDSDGHFASAGEIALVEGDTVPTVEGQVVPKSAMAIAYPTEFTLVSQRDELIRLDLPELEPRWRASLLDPNVELLAADASRIVVRYPTADGVVVVIDADTGEQVWGSGPLREPLLRLRTAPMETQSQNMQIAGVSRRLVDRLEAISMPVDNGVLTVGRSGGVMRLPFDTEIAQPEWSTDHGLSEVHYIAHHDLAVVLAGVPTRAVNSEGQVVLIDPDTGETLHRFNTIGGEPIRWLATAAQGVAVYGTAAAIEAIDLLTGELLWAHVGDDVDIALRGTVFGDWVIVADANADVRAISLVDGTTSSVAFQPPADATWQPRQLVQVHDLGDRLLAQYRERLVWFDRHGVVAGADSIAKERLFTDVLIGDRFVYAVSHIPDTSGPRTSRSGRRFVNLVYTMSHNGKLIGAPHAIPADRDTLYATAIIDGWLFLSDLNQTAILPAPAAQPNANDD